MKSFRAKFKKDGPHAGHVFLVPSKDGGNYAFHCSLGHPVRKKTYRDVQISNAGTTDLTLRGVELYNNVEGDVGRFAQVLYERVIRDDGTSEADNALADIKAVVNMYGFEIAMPNHVTRTQICRALLRMTDHGSGTEEECDIRNIQPGADRKTRYKKFCLEEAANQIDAAYEKNRLTTFISWVLNTSFDGALPWIFSHHSMPETATYSLSIEIQKEDYERSLTKGELAYLAEEIHHNTANPMFALAGGRSF